METGQHPHTVDESENSPELKINSPESIKASNLNSLTNTPDLDKTMNQTNSHGLNIIETEDEDMFPAQPTVSDSKTTFMEDFASKLDINESSDSMEDNAGKLTKESSILMDTGEAYCFSSPQPVENTNIKTSSFTNDTNSLNISNENATAEAALPRSDDSSEMTTHCTDESKTIETCESPSADTSVLTELNPIVESDADKSAVVNPADSSTIDSLTSIPDNPPVDISSTPAIAVLTDTNTDTAADSSQSDFNNKNTEVNECSVIESEDYLNESHSSDLSDKPLRNSNCLNESDVNDVSIDDVSMQAINTDVDKDKHSSDNMAALFEHVDAENDDKEEEKDEEIAVTTSSKGQDEDPIDCWPLNADPKDILSICPEDNDECIIPDDEKEGDSVKTFPQTETKEFNEEEQTGEIASKQEDCSDSSATPKEPEKSYDLAMDEAPSENRCIVCLLTKSSRYHFSYQNEEKYICDEICLKRFKENPTIGLEKTQRTDSSSADAHPSDGNGLDGSTGNAISGVSSGPGAPKAGTDQAISRTRDKPKARACADCKNPVLSDINSYSWEAMDFCSEACLARYQKQIGGFCQQCNIPVRNNVLGKYCVRFGSALRQFCSGGCLEMHKRDLRLCTYCQEDLGENSSVECEAGKKFCTSACMHNFASMTTNRLPVVPQDSVCCVCINRKTIEIIFERDGVPFMFCGNPCLVAYKFVNKVSPAKCGFCYKYVERDTLDDFTMFYEGKLRSFCSNICKNIYIIAHRKIVPCSWCKVKKYNFDMIRKTSARNQIFNICSLNCLKYFNTSLSVVTSRSRQICDYCTKSCKPVYHLTMSDGSTRNFCTHQCVTDFQKKFERRQQEPAPTPPPSTNNRVNSNATPPTETPFSKQPLHQYHGKKGARGRQARKQVLPDRPGPLPVITSVCSLAPSAQGTSTGGVNTDTGTDDESMPSIGLSIPKPSEPVPQKTKRLLVVQRPSYIEQRNVMTTASPMNCEKDTNFTPDVQEKHCQTDIPDEAIQVIPIPIPIYVPSPMFAYYTPLPTPIPFPFPIPVPILIPITKHTSENLMKEIKQKVQVKGPTDPFEAELLMMAELVAAEKKDAMDLSDDDGDGPDGADDGYSPEPADSSGFGEDMLQMALKMASDFDQQAVDLEGALTASTITPQQQQQQQAHHHAMVEGEEGVVMDDSGQHMSVGGERGRGRRRAGSGTRQRSYGARRGRRSGANAATAQHHQQMELGAQMAPPEPPPPPEPVEKPDAHMCLKYTFGVNAWKQWVTTKNVELERSSRRLKPFKTELLQLTSDELNYSLCLFVKEVRKPNGSEYAPDTIYYLCLGIQQYLFENGRIDNIFCDSYYDKFTEVLDEVCKKFSALYNDSHYIVTRVEEEHLWESKQLGAHSPHVLLSTLMFFNTKHFNLTSVDEHMQLSFSHIMKHWKRNPNQPANATAAKTPGSRNVLLRFYPPQAALESNSRKKKVYEQQENEENPLRCPVKLYEFYLSKCPESVKTRNDVFYLMPERSCVPDSPVWYSTIAQERPALEKMLHRVKMVKEINVALLTT